MTLTRFLSCIVVALWHCLAAADPGAALARLADRYYEAQARLDPVYSATLIGDNRFDDQLPITIAPAHRKKRFAMYREVRRELAAIPRGAPGTADALTHDLLAWQLELRLGFEPFNDHLLPLQQMDSVPLLLAIFASGQAEQPLQTAAQLEAYRRRIAQLPAWCDQAIANMREGMRLGIVQPRPVVAATLTQLRPLGHARLADNPFWSPARSLPASLSQADRRRLVAAYSDTVANRVAPAMRRLAHFVENEYLPASRELVGWSALPDGAAWYRQWVREQTTTDLAPEEIHAIGLQEVARIHAELARTAPQLGHQGDPRRLLAWVRTQDKFLPYRSEAQILEAYRAINETVTAHLPRLFGRQPKAALDIRAEPERTRATATDRYGIPAEDGTRPGIFWAVIPDPARYDATGMTALFLHEGQPGHHFQMAMQQEMKQLARFRQRLWINAYGEGWALYAETLGHEMGLYRDPAAHVGELRLEIARAARLVVDTGMHAKGWSREQAVAYWMDNVGASEVQAQQQIDRYLAWPAQALGYKLGSLKIQSLRQRAKQRLGDRFSMAAFHDAVLGEGPLPLSMLEARIDRWIDTQP
ncbi:DUF885 domain-containing protein [Piscinibacter sp. XHJ-5]|uniref:DUF885 domain-containing protein n=1 Tax=Piscinibacter sp. XHJ-5 TaxID=3037797 RepID=UPI002452E2AB|nr:DUF885 domain-containing protein [Piscinibacter sp. XHJ-5]